MVQRVTYKRRLSYNTTSNRKRILKTPGGKLTISYTKKPASKPKCGDCGNCLAGVKAVRPHKLAIMSKRNKVVSRAYGGSRCGDCVRSRIVRAFLTEERNVVKKMLKASN